MPTLYVITAAANQQQEKISVAKRLTPNNNVWAADLTQKTYKKDLHFMKYPWVDDLAVCSMPIDKHMQKRITKFATNCGFNVEMIEL